MATVGERIKIRRKELGLSVDDVAEKLGKNRATIYRYESDYIENLPITIINPLAEVLQTTPAYLMGWDIEKETIVDDVKTIIKGFKENEEFFDSISSHSDESFNNFNNYLYSTFENEIKDIGDTFTAMHILSFYEYVNRILSFELSKVAESKKEISKPKDNITELITVTNQKFEDKPHLMPIASHDKEGNFTSTEYKHDDDIMNNDDLWNK